jgi:type I restriction-modification system DNA methylase subunit
MNIQNNISNKEALKDKIHEIHNFLRNNGAGYGMNALKVFNIVYGLKKITDGNLRKKVNLSDKCDFNYLLELANSGQDEKLCSLIINNILDELHNNNILKNFLFYEIPKNMKSNVFSHLVKEINTLSEIEKSSNVQLSGKIYEYFIGRDQTAISELGAYFTDRHIVNYIYDMIQIQPNEDGTIPVMIDMFGGSGGFTTGYVNYMNKNYSIDWSSNINNIHHYDANVDVIKSAALELFCLTGELPNMNNLQYKNSFTDKFNDEKYELIITNPPYGGDKNKKSDAQIKRDKLKDHIKHELKSLKDKDIIMRRKNQLKKIIDEEEFEDKIKEKQKVTINNSSQRIKKFAKNNKLKGNDKESVSLIQLMEMSASNGKVIGVLKEGVFFNKTYKDIRKYLIENFNVKKIISIPKDQFENTSTKTSIIYFENTEEKTSTVEFYELEVEKITEDKFEEIDGDLVLTENQGDIKCVNEKLVTVATKNTILNSKSISLNGKDYNKIKITPANGYELIKLDNIISILKTDNIIYNERDKCDEGYNYYTCSPHIKKINKYNIDGEYLLMGTRGTIEDSIHYYNGKFSVGNNMIVFKSSYNIKYMYYILTVHKELIRYTCNCTTVPAISISQFKNIKISIPKDKQKMNEWVDKISKPYNEKLEIEQRIQKLNKELQERVKFISENEDCEIKTIDDISSIVYGERITKAKCIKGIYPVYGGGGISFYNKTKNYSGKNIIISRYAMSRECVRVIYGDFHLLDSGMTLSLKEETDKVYIYNYLLRKDIQKDIYENYTNSTIQTNINIDLFKKFKLKIPKNKQLIEEMEPQFLELEQLHIDVKNADKKYNDLIKELKNEAIKQ